MSGNDVADLAYAQRASVQEQSFLDQLERRRTKPAPLPTDLQRASGAPLKPDDAAGPKSGPTGSVDEIQKKARAEWNAQQDQSVIDDANADAKARGSDAGDPSGGVAGLANFSDSVPGAVKTGAFAANDIAEAVVELFPHSQSLTNIGKAPLSQEKAEWHAGNLAGAFAGATNAILALNDAVYEYRTGDALDDDQKLRVPDPGPTDTVTGNLSRGIAQFMIGFKGADKMLGPALQGLSKGGKVAQFGSITLKSALADFMVFDPEEGRLSDMLMEIPDDHTLAPIKKIVPEFLVSDEDDGQFKGRLKNVAEGGIIGGVLDSIYLVATSIKRTKEAQKAVDDTITAIEADEAGIADADEEFMAVFDEYMPGFRDRPEEQPGPEAFEFDDALDETPEEAAILDQQASKFDEVVDESVDDVVDYEAVARDIEAEAERQAAEDYDPDVNAFGLGPDTLEEAPIARSNVHDLRARQSITEQLTIVSRMLDRGGEEYDAILRSIGQELRDVPLEQAREIFQNAARAAGIPEHRIAGVGTDVARLAPRNDPSQVDFDYEGLRAEGAPLDSRASNTPLRADNDDIDVQAEAVIARAEEDPDVYDIIADEIDESPQDVQRALDELYNGNDSDLGQRVLEAYRNIEADDAALRLDAETGQGADLNEMLDGRNYDGVLRAVDAVEEGGASKAEVQALFEEIVGLPPRQLSRPKMLERIRQEVASRRVHDHHNDIARRVFDDAAATADDAILPLSAELRDRFTDSKLFEDRLARIKSKAEARQVYKELFGRDIFERPGDKLSELIDQIQKDRRRFVNLHIDNGSPEMRPWLDDGGELKFARPEAGREAIDNAKMRVLARRKLRHSAMRAIGEKEYIELEDAGRVSYADTGTVIDKDLDTEFVMEGQLAVTMPDGRMIINSSVARPDEIPGLMLHEIGIHGGLKEFLGQQGYDTILRALDDALDGRDADVAIARQRAMDDLEGQTFLQGRAFDEAANERVRRGLDPNDALTMATFRAQTRANDPSHVKEEILAYLVQFSPENSLVQRVMGTMKAHIAKRFPNLAKHLRWSEADFRQLAILSLKAQARKARGMPFRYRDQAQADTSDASTMLMVEGDGRGVLGAPKPNPLVLEDVVQPIRLKELKNLPATVREMEPQLRSGRVMEAIAAKHGGEALFEYGDLLDAAVDGMMTTTQAMRLKQLLAPLEDMALPIAVKPSRPDYEPWEFSDKLTDAQNTIVKLLREGHTYREAADLMDMSVESLRGHISHVRKRLPSAVPAGLGHDKGEQARWIIDLAERNRREKLGLTNKMIAERASGAFGRTITVNNVKSTLSQARRRIREDGRVPKFSQRGPGDDTFDPYAAPPPYLNLDRIKDIDGLRAEVERLAAQGADEAQKRVGRPRTLAQVEQQAAHANAFDALVKSRGGKTLDPAEALALRQLRDASAERLMAFARRYEAQPTPQGKLALQNARLMHYAIQAEVSGQSAAAARALGSLRILSGPTAQARRQLESAVARLGDEANFDQFAREIARLGKNQQKELDKLVKYSLGQNIADAGGAWFRAMILSAPLTHAVNIAGNTAIMAFDIASHFTGGALMRLTGDARGAEMMMQAALKGQAVLDGIMHQLQFAKQHSQLVPFKKNFGVKFDDMGVSGRQVDAADRRAVTADRWGLDENGVLGQFVEMVGAGLAAPSGALGVMDDFFKGVNYMGEMRALAHRVASNELRAGRISRENFKMRIRELLEEPTQSMIDQAQRAAKERTFTTDPGPALMASLKLRRWMNGLGLPIGHYFLPFVLTPANIMSYTFKSLPVTNYALREVREALARGGQDAYRARGQMAMGTGVLALAWQLGSQGILTGGGPTDPSQRKAMQSNQGLGWSPYTIRTENFSFAYDRFDPIGNLLAFGGELAEYTSNRELNAEPDEDFIALVGSAAAQIGKSMMDKSYLTGVRDVVAALNDPDRDGGKFLQRLVTAHVAPSGGAAYRRVDDPFMREAFSTMDMIKNRLPFGGSKTLPKKFDHLGRPAMYQSGLGSVYDSFVPFIAKTIDPEPIDEEMMRLRYFPTLPDRAITINYAGRSVNLSLKADTEIYSRMTELMGGDPEYNLEPVIKKLNRRIKSKDYESLADGPEPIRFTSKAWAIQQIIQDHRTQVRQIIMQEYGLELRDRAKKQLERQLEFAAEQSQGDGGEVANQLLEQLERR